MAQPLAWRMRPQQLADIVGQQHLVGPGKIIARMVKAKQLSSMILYGPPGTGKTSIASAIAGSTKYAFRTLNAATNTKKDLQAVAEEARMSGTVILLLDEIHRLDKTKQDFLLPLLESGRIILIGATTENPYMTINPAIRSRTQIFEVYPLKPDEIKVALKRALTDEKNGLGQQKIDIADDTLDFLAQRTNGDLRSALNGLELAVNSTTPTTDGVIELTLTDIEESIQKKSFSHDKNGDAHYDVISAFQKSIRGSDTDAALHYLAELIVAGDLTSIMRRLMVIAYEDIGLANPAAAARTVSACQAAERLGLPEARIPLANSVIELCLSPKSNSAIQAVDAAISNINNGKAGQVPRQLQDAHYAGAKDLHHGDNYQFPHDAPNDWLPQQYLPDIVAHQQYYKPKNNGKIEAAYAQQYRQLRQAQRDGLKNKNGS
ncbi:replication-associated recombination protein A [Lapidilactobacillus mulanensis]|uniref:Replication-associated recombination protein A n=1 Tax=Lapidilactobacillus mulanensis TaxID=2485999 RepID=A0ABW4DKF7_9LACO|nr:replication-associated recombination protein A [Lapidilactobacillus mulanensis]